MEFEKFLFRVFLFFTVYKFGVIIKIATKYSVFP